MATNGPSVSSAWNDRMRLIRLRRKKESPRFREELRVIPRWLKNLCLVLYLVAVGIGIAVVHFNPEARPGNIPDITLATLAVVGMITGVAIVLSCFLMMLGYVYRDARRRNMNAPLWTLLVFILSPSSMMLGLIIYLLVRDPLPYPCPRCTAPVGPRFNFCPNCKCDLHPSCPNCKQEIAETDKFCPNCANDLAKPAEPALLPTSPAPSPE